MTVPTASDTERRLLEEAGLWCVRLADDALTPEDYDAFDAWLSTSPAHRRAFDDTVRSWHGVEEIGIQPEIIALRQEALEDFSKANRRRWTKRLPMPRWALALAASLLAALLGLALWVQMMPTRYETGIGERRITRLEDGSRLSLDADTLVKVRFTDERRELQLLRGRAKFDVAKDPLRPFTVTAANKMVVAVGTQFSVELLQRKVHVVLFEGQVAVLAKPEAAEAPQPLKLAEEEPAALVPGTELVAAVSDKAAHVQPADPARALSWETGLISFTDEPLASAVERMNRYSQDKLYVGNAAAAQTTVNGLFVGGDTEAFIEGVTGVLPVRLVVQNGRRTFVR